MIADLHRQPGDSDKHLADWRTRSVLTDDLDVGGENFAADGEVYWRQSIPYTKDSVNSITNTTYQNAINSINLRPMVELADITDQISGTVQIKFLVSVTNDTAGETTFARLKSNPTGSEVSATGTSFAAVASEWVDYGNNLTAIQHIPGVEAKVSGGTGRLLAPTVQFGVQL